MEIETEPRRWLLFLTFAFALFVIGLKLDSIIRSLLAGESVGYLSYAVVISLSLSAFVFGLQLYGKKNGAEKDEN